MPEHVTLQQRFYHDRLYHVVLLYLLTLIVLGTLIALSCYLYLVKPKPVTFQTYTGFRVQPDVPLNQRYLSDPQLVQWLSRVIPQVFSYDFVHDADQVQQVRTYFTADGWQSFANHLNAYANPNVVTANRLFVSANLTGAPSINQEAYLGSTAAWTVQVPIMVNYAGGKPLPNKALTLQVLVVRVSTLSDLNGVAIQNISITPVEENGIFG